MSNLLLKALTQYGIKEVPGEKNNPDIVKYFNVLGDGQEWTDEFAWCSAFLNWACIESGKESSGALNARSWLAVGRPVTIPILGDIVIYWRESKSSWKGHVGIYINAEADADAEVIYTLGGNQGNMVCVKPYYKSSLLGYRRI
jgi:uncharacterized protein (TIGR02594 family)